MSEPKEFWIGKSISGWTAVETHKAYELMAPNPETAILVIEKRAYCELQNRIEFLEGIIEEYYNLCDSLVVSFPAFERKAMELFNKAELPAKKEKAK